LLGSLKWDWNRRYADRIDTWPLPTSKAKQDELALHYAQDGYTLLQAVYTPSSPQWLRELPAVQALRIVLVQNYTRTADRANRLRVRRRERTEDGGDGLPPAPSRLASPYDTDAAGLCRPIRGEDRFDQRHLHVHRRGLTGFARSRVPRVSQFLMFMFRRWPRR
jgi:hypothetical protein